MVGGLQQIQVRSLSVSDAADTARNNVSAFWREPNWRIMWPSDMDVEFLIAQSTKRQARNLLRDSAKTRHQKAVDSATGALVGYARWVLPDSVVVETTALADADADVDADADADGSSLWPEAQAPTVSDAERERFDELAASASWPMRPEVEHADDRASAEKRRILSERPYLVLDYLAVHPKNQGKGIGSVLVESGLQQARLMGLPVFILAFKGALGVYRRLGFREAGRVVEDMALYGGEGEYGMYFMVNDSTVTDEKAVEARAERD